MIQSERESSLFSDAMALEHVGDGLYLGELNKHWTIGPKLHGGVLAVAVRGGGARSARRATSSRWRCRRITSRRPIRAR